MKLNTLRRGTAAGAVLALSLTLAACSSEDEEPTTTGSDTPAATDEGDDTEEAADPQAQTFGPACDQVPADGDGSFVGMSEAPVANAATANPLLEQLVGAVGAVNGLADTLNGAPELTVFAPFNGAFEELDQEAVGALVEEAMADETGTNSTLYGLLAHHVVGANLDADAVVGEQDTLAGDTLTIEGDTDGMTVSDGTVTADVLCGNIPTANATVYVIGSVLAGPIS